MGADALPRRLGIGRPALWLFALAAFGWIVLARSAAVAGLAAPLCGGAGWVDALHLRSYGFLLSASVPELAGHGAAMALVMLFPGALAPLDHVRRSSFRAARARQMLLFALSFGLLWAVFSAMAAALVAWPALVDAGLRLPVAAAALVCAWRWETSSAKLSAATQCHASRPIYADGWAGAASAIGYGAYIGSACVRSCGPLMLAAMAFPLPLPAMAGAALLAARERIEGPRAIEHNGRILALAAAAAILLSAVDIAGRG